MQGSSDVLQFRIPPDKTESKFSPEQLDQIAEKFGLSTSYTSPDAQKITNVKISDPINLNPVQSSAILKRSIEGKQKLDKTEPHHCEKHDYINKENYPKHTDSMRHKNLLDQSR